MFASLHTAQLTCSGLQSGRMLPVGGFFHRLLRTAELSRIARRQRDALARLDDHALEDIGLTRDEAFAEANRPLWDVPNAWRR
ncbi:DUF1127 domain-containing protein [Paracoccaceae bacterium Fryx2]|nr:DUF1127 domain-containing protein [Paracoccaceae bacterium Fryx2]